MKDKMKKLWTNFMVKAKVLVPLGTEGVVRFNVKNPVAYVLLLLTMVVYWLLDIVYAVLVTTCEGFYSMVMVYINTIRKAFDDAKQDKLMKLKEELNKEKGKVKTVTHDNQVMGFFNGSGEVKMGVHVDAKKINHIHNN